MGCFAGQGICEYCGQAGKVSVVTNEEIVRNAFRASSLLTVELEAEFILRMSADAKKENAELNRKARTGIANSTNKSKRIKSSYRIADNITWGTPISNPDAIWGLTGRR
jgi:hypothetical protein